MNERQTKNYFADKTCLVTGGAGFIGSSLVEELISHDAKVRVVDNLSVGTHNLKLIKGLGADFLEIDVCNFDLLSDVFKKVEIVFHLAAMNRAQRSINDPIASNNVNVNGTLNCLHLSHLNNIQKFVFVSSSSVYKGVQNETLKEDMKLEPLHPYGVGKLASEHYCRIYNDLFNLNTTILRYFSVYGPRQRGGIEHAGVIAKFFLQAKNNKDITIYGDGKQKRNFSFVTDVAKGTVLAAEKQDVKGHVINIASEHESTVLEIAQKIVKITGSSSNIVHLKPLKGDPARNRADVNKSKKLLGFSAKYSIDEGLKFINERL